MALTYTPEAELGALCPDFKLPAVDGKIYSLADFKSARVLLIMFICNHCPYVKAIEDRILSLGREMAPRGVQLVAICANDPAENEDDSFENLRRRAAEKAYPFPYLQDEPQTTARAFGAVCTPDFFVYDENRRLAYRGRLDDSWKNPHNVQRQELKEALETLLAGRTPGTEQTPSMGCSIKWKA